MTKILGDFQLVDGKPRLMAISLWQPWASLIAWGFKRFETRSWATNYRGPLVIQSAKTTRGLDWCNDYINRALDTMCEVPADLPLGAALAVVDLVDVFKTDALRDAVTDDGLPMVSEREKAFGDWRDGRYAWKLENVRIIKPPIPMRGYQQIFDIEADTRAAILKAIGGQS